MAEHDVDVALVDGDRDEFHAALAPRAGEDVGGKHPAEQPRPGMPGGRGSGRRLERGGDAYFEEGKLFGLFFYVGRRCRNDLGADLGMGSEDTVIPERVNARRRYESTEACEKIEGIENDRACPVFPGSFEAVANAPVLANVEAVLGERRPCDVAAEALESLSVPTVDRDLGVDVDAADFGDRALRGGTAHEGRSDEFRGLVSRGLSEELDVVCGGGVAGGEDGRVVMERVGAGFVDDAFEGPAVTVEDAEHTRVSPGGDLSDIVVGRRLEGVEGQLSFFVADVDAVEREGMEMDVEPERTVASLHEGDGANERVLHRAEAEGALRTMAHRPGEGVEEDLQDVGAKSAVVPHGGAQAPRQGAHPLADRHLGKDLVDQVGGDIIHSPAETRRAETAAFTAERGHDLVAAPSASELDEAMLEEAALEVGLELTDDKPRQASVGFGLLEEPGPVGFHHPMQAGLFRTTTRVAVRADGLGAGERPGVAGHEGPEASPIVPAPGVSRPRARHRSSAARGADAPANSPDSGSRERSLSLL